MINELQKQAQRGDSLYGINYTHCAVLVPHEKLPFFFIIIKNDPENDKKSYITLHVVHVLKGYQ